MTLLKWELLQSNREKEKEKEMNFRGTGGCILLYLDWGPEKRLVSCLCAKLG